MKIKTWLKYFVHNCIVHPILPFVPKSVAHTLHDVNADWAFKKEIVLPKQPVEVKTFLDDMEDTYKNTHLIPKHTETKKQSPTILPDISFKPGQIICASNS